MSESLASYVSVLELVFSALFMLSPKFRQTVQVIIVGSVKSQPALSTFGKIQHFRSLD